MSSTWKIGMVAAIAAGAALLVSCGGGGGGNNNSTATTNLEAMWVKGQFLPEADFAQRCVSPRSGTDSVTLKAYTDTQGTALDEKNWLRSWTNDLYLWYSEVVDLDPATFTSDATYFAALKTTATTASGAAQDKFHFTYPTPVWESLEKSGVEAGYGANFTVIAASPPRNVVVSYTEPGSPAAVAPASLARGAKVLTVDGVDLINADDQASVTTINAGLAPSMVGETHIFTILDLNATAPRTVTLVSANITETPVQNVKTVVSSTGMTVGYLLFNDQLATAEDELVTAFTQLKSAGVQDLVLDIRYNGGGLLDIASEVAYMIAGPSPTAGQTFELTQFNSKYPTTDPVTGNTITPVGFHSTTQGFGSTTGQALPTLNLMRVFVLTTADTCSASESIMNSLQGINVQVIQVGSTTCGKPYGFYPADNCAVTYFSIQFRGVNAKNFGDYPDGFTPANATAAVGVSVPGCSVADDYTHALGDPDEGLFASALSYGATGACPVAPSGIAPAASIKSLLRQNRLYRHVPTT